MADDPDTQMLENAVISQSSPLSSIQQPKDSSQQGQSAGASPLSQSNLATKLTDNAAQMMPSPQDIDTKRQGLMDAYQKLIAAQSYVPPPVADLPAASYAAGALHDAWNPSITAQGEGLTNELKTRMAMQKEQQGAQEQQAATGLAAAQAGTGFNVQDLKQAMDVMNANSMNNYHQNLINLRTNAVSKDEFGNPILVDKVTGQKKPLTGQDIASFNTTPAQPNANGGMTPDFGFSDNPYAGNPMAGKLAMTNAAAFEKSKQARDTLTDQALSQISELEPDIKQVHAGNALANLGLSVSGLTGSGEAPAAQAASAESKALALTLSNMQQQPGGRAMKAALTTLLQSKPDPYANLPSTNEKLVNNAKDLVYQYKRETDFLDAYKQANPFHTIDQRAYDLFEAANKKLPVMSIDPKTGKSTINQDNIDSFNDAIPDALANPYNYIKRPGGAAPQAPAAAPNQAAAGSVPPAQQQIARQEAMTRGLIDANGNLTAKGKQAAGVQ